MRKIQFILLATVAAMALTTMAQQMPVYLNADAPIEQRIEDALARMTLDEKIAVIHAQSKFSSPGVKRLGMPDFWTDDGPHGVRPDVLWDEWEQAGQTNDVSGRHLEPHARPTLRPQSGRRGTLSG